MNNQDSSEEEIDTNLLSAEEFREAFPATDLAYNLALQAYDVAHKRFDAIELRIHNLLVFATSITLAIPTIAKLAMPNLNITSPFFVGAIFFYFAAISMGTWIRFSGDVIVLDPSKIYDQYMALNEPHFKSTIVYYAGEHFQTNKTTINSKAFWATMVTFLLFLEGFSFSFWLLVHH